MSSKRLNIIFKISGLLFLLSTTAYVVYSMIYGIKPAYFLNMLCVLATVILVVVFETQRYSTRICLRILSIIMALNLCSSIIIESIIADNEAVHDIYLLVMLVFIPFLLAIVSGSRQLPAAISLTLLICYVCSCIILKDSEMYKLASACILPYGLSMILFKKIIFRTPAAEPVSHSAIDMERSIVQILKHNYPEITQSELQICWYIILGKTVSEICYMRNVSSSTVTSTRSRLRKKFGLEKGDGLQGFLIELIEQNGIDLKDIPIENTTPIFS